MDIFLCIRFILMNYSNSKQSGFTLVEMSMVLVIIGLVIGGVLVGQDLISAAEVRSQISQIEKYKTVANVFKGKYDYLPGDIPEPYASQFGFIPAMYTTVHGDGNGLVETYNGSGVAEMNFFFADLSTAGLIPEKVTHPTNVSGYYNSIFEVFPEAKIGSKNYITPLSGGVFNNSSFTPIGTTGVVGKDGQNYLTINYSGFFAWNDPLNPMLTVADAHNIDKKTDDGLPQSGNVIAAYWNWKGRPGCCKTFAWAGLNVNNATNDQPTTTAIAPDSTTCYDNGNVSGGVQKYSMSQNKGKGINCGVSFKMK